MNILTRLAVGSLTVLAVAAPVLTGSPAQAATAKTWTTVEGSHGAKQQACKVLTNAGTDWRIYNRLDSRRATGPRLHASMTVTKDSSATASRWDSGWVQKGRLSGTGTVVLPRKPGYALQMTIGGDQFGGGGTLTAARVGHC